MFSYLVAATPGLREFLTVGKVWELAQPDRRTPGAHPYDLVILDAPATGHGVAVLTAPQTFADAARVGPIARQGAIIHEMLADPEQTAIVAVATAEEMPVNETLALRDALRDELGQRFAGVVVNGVLPTRFRRADVAALESVGAGGSRAVRAARAEAARARAHRAQVARLRRGVGGVEVRTLPFLFEHDGLDGDALARLGEELVR
jgi:anion-transporting  ArsA/GET3 family ATPase